MKLNKKMKISLTFILIIFIIILSTTLVLFNKSRVRFNIEESEKKLLSDYRYLDLYTLDEFDISLYFGLELKEIPSSLFLTDFELNKEEPAAFNPKVLVVIINSNTPSEYYDFFKDYSNMNINNSEDKKVVKFYKNAILKKGKNYMYFIAGKDKKDIEKTILNLKK